MSTNFILINDFFYVQNSKLKETHFTILQMLRVDWYQDLMRQYL